MMKLNLLLLLLFAFAVLLGCIDITEHISLEPNNIMHVFLRLNLSKSLLSLASSDKNDYNPCNDLLNSFKSDYEKSFPKEIEYNLANVEDEIDCSVLLNFKYDLFTTNFLVAYHHIDFLPYESYGDLIIPISGVSNIEDYYLSLVSKRKFRLSISKTYTSHISKVIVSTKSIDYKPEIIELSDLYILEIPMAYIITKTGSKIVITK